MGYEFEVYGWALKETRKTDTHHSGIEQQVDDYEWVEVYRGGDLDIAISEMKCAKEKYGCVRLEWRK